MGKKTRETIFPETHEMCDQKMLGKIVGKSAKKRFLYSHENHPQKMGAKNTRNNFYRSTRIERAKNVGIKIVGKSAKKRFLNSHEYHHQKMGGKTRETIFTEAHE